MGFLASWPPGAIITLAGLILTNAAMLAGWLHKRLSAAESSETERIKLGWAEANHQGQLVETLRRLLDRGRRRENAYSTGFELLLIALPPDMTPEQTQIVKRAREVFEGAIYRSGGDEGRG